MFIPVITRVSGSVVRDDKVWVDWETLVETRGIPPFARNSAARWCTLVVFSI